LTKTTFHLLVSLTAQKALDKLGEEMGCKIELGRITYGNYEMRSKITVTINTPEAAPKIPSFIPIDKIVTYGGVQYQVTGYKPSSRKYPVVVKRVRDGKGFRLSLSAIK